MNLMKINIKKILFLLLLQQLCNSAICHPGMPDFFEADNTTLIPILQRDIHVPVGEAADEIHHVFLPTGTPLQAIAAKISEKREEIGLSPEISLDQQGDFFHYFNWQTRKNRLIKSPLLARMCKVSVYQGQQVQLGDPLCSLEAMKMEIIIRSPAAGEITGIFSIKNDSVHEHSLLITLLGWEDINQEDIANHKELLIPFFPWAKSSLIEAPPPPQEPSSESDKTKQQVVSEAPHEADAVSLVPLDDTKPPLNPPAESNIPVPQHDIEIQGEPPLNPLQAQETVSPQSSLAEQKPINIVENKEDVISEVAQVIQEPFIKTEEDVAFPPSVSSPVSQGETKPALNLPAENNIPVPQHDIEIQGKPPLNPLQAQETVSPRSSLAEQKPINIVENKEDVISEVAPAIQEAFIKIEEDVASPPSVSYPVSPGEAISPQSSLPQSNPINVIENKENIISERDTMSPKFFHTLNFAASIKQEKSASLIQEKSPLQMKFSFPKVSKFSKDTQMSEPNNDENISLGSWAKWIYGLTILCPLLLSLGIMIYYRLMLSQAKKIYYTFFFLEEFKYSSVLDFNKQNIIILRTAHNMNSRWWLKNRTLQGKRQTRLAL